MLQGNKKGIPGDASKNKSKSRRGSGGGDGWPRSLAIFQRDHRNARCRGRGRWRILTLALSLRFGPRNEARCLLVRDFTRLSLTAHHLKFNRSEANNVSDLELDSLVTQFFSVKESAIPGLTILEKEDILLPRDDGVASGDEILFDTDSIPPVTSQGDAGSIERNFSKAFSIRSNDSQQDLHIPRFRWILLQLTAGENQFWRFIRRLSPSPSPRGYHLSPLPPRNRSVDLSPRFRWLLHLLLAVHKAFWNTKSWFIMGPW